MGVGVVGEGMTVREKVGVWSVECGCSRGER